MDKNSLAAILALLGISANDKDNPLLDLLNGAAGMADKPDPRSLTFTAGSITAAWYSLHTISVDVCVLGPVGAAAQTRFTHPGLGPRPTASELWDYLYICLAGIAARMAQGDKVRGCECAESIKQSRVIAEKLAALSPFPAQPWNDTPRVGKFTVTQMLAAKPPLLVAHTLDMAYRQARHMSAARMERINALATVLAEKKLMMEDDFQAVLGPRTFAFSRRTSR